jgi:prolyl 4-hydroxylase
MLCKRLSVLCLVAFLSFGNAAFWDNKKAKEDAPKEDAPKQADEPAEYGVDVSFPIHHQRISTNYDWLPHNIDTTKQTPRAYKDMVPQPLGNREEFYNNFLDSCVKHFGKKGKRCIANESERISMSLRQPQSMQNYTEVGFKKIRAPPEVYNLIKEFWDKNKDKSKVENWGVGNTYTNNWESPSTMVSVEDSGLRGGGKTLKNKLWNAARDVIQGALVGWMNHLGFSLVCR